MAESRYDNFRYDEENYGGVATGVVPPVHTGPYLSLFVGATNWTSRTLWGTMRFTSRKDIGAAASIELDATDVTDSAPTCSENFILTFPSQEIYVMVPVVTPKTFYRKNGTGETIIVYSYELVDLLTAMDRLPLPQRQYIESTAGAIITDLISEMNSGIDTSGVVAGNDVPFLDTKDFAKFSDVVKSSSIQGGGYTIQVNPLLNNGFAVTADYFSNFGSSGVTVDKDSQDWTPQKDDIAPDSNIVNSQRVKSSQPGPDHTVCEFREIDAENSSFKLKNVPYGLDGTELINFQVDGGDLSAAQVQIDVDIAAGSSPLPNVIPLHYPVQIEIADITISGAAEIGAFQGTGGSNILSAITGSNFIGAKISGTDYTQLIPFVPGGATPDLNHQYYYDWYAFFSVSGLQVLVVENYLNNLAGETQLGVILSLDQSAGTVTLNLTGVSDVSALPESIRFYATGDPSDIRGFSNIKSRSGSTVVIDNWPEGLVVGDVLSYGDGATTTVTEKIIYDGSAPTNRYGAPKLVASGSGVTARQWTASYGPAIDAILLDNPYTGVAGRRLRVDTVSSRSTDMVISKSGNTAICTFVGDRLPLTGVLRFILNYDAAKIIDVTVEDETSQARCGIRQGQLITSDAVQTEAEATALAQAVLDDFANSRIVGTLIRESYLVSSLPLPNQTVSIEEPDEFRITDQTVPIEEISVSFKGYDWEADEGMLEYQITLGNVNAVEAVNRQLLANQVSTGLSFRPLSATGARISSGTWNDTDTVTIGVSGSVTLNGRPASASFNPADYAVGNLREAPVSIAGTITSGGKVGELLVEIIYPPLDVDAASETCSYSPRTNLITYRWGRPAGRITYKIMRQVDDGTGTGTLVYREIDEIFTESYPLPYEPTSKAIKIKTLGLGLKEGAGGFITLECTLPILPAPDTFEIVPGKAVKPSGRIPFLVSAPPTIVGSINYTNRVEFLTILLTKTPLNDPPTVRSDFDNSDENLVTINIPYSGVTEAMRHPVFYEEMEPGESVWATAFWKDKFGDEGDNTDPFDVLHPPVTAGSISVSTFFRTPNPLTPLTNQAAGGTIEDDNETTPQVEHTLIGRVILGNHNSAVKIWVQESEAGASIGTYSSAVYSSHRVECTDQDVLNGYIDVTMKQDFRWAKKKPREYQIDSITFIGPNIRQRPDGSGNPNNDHEKRFLVGYTGSPPPIVDHSVDAVFDKSLFRFRPGVNGLANNFSVVANVSVFQKPEALKVRWDRFADDASVRRYFIAIHTANFGTNGPAATINIATDLNLIATSGDIILYDPTNTTRTVIASVLDAGDRGHHTFLNGDAVGSLTVTAGVTYYVSVIAQLQNGRYSTAFATVANTTAGIASPPEDTAAASAVQSLRLLWGAKKKGFKSDWIRPASNIKSLKGYKIYYSNNAGTSFMNPETGLQASPNTAVGGTVFVTDTRHTTGVERSELHADFAAGVKVTVVPVNNVGGVETDGASSTSSFVAPAGEDTGAPGAVQNLTLIWSRKKGWKATWGRPATNVLSLQGYKVVFFNNAGTSFMVATTGIAASPDNEATATFFTHDTAYATLLLYSQLAAGFQAGVKVKVTPVNIVQGVETDGTTATSSLVAPTTDDPVASDTAVPSGLGTPVLSWQAKAFHIKDMTVSTQWNQPYKKYLVIYDGSSTYFNLPGYFAGTQVIGSTSESSSRLEFGPGKNQLTLGIRLADLKTVLGSSATMKAYFYAENVATQGTLSSASSASNGIALATAKDIVSSRDAVNVVDIGVTMISNVNNLFNGDNLYGDTTGAGAVLNHKKSALPFSGGSAITSTTTDDVFWVQADHCLKWRSNASRIYMPLKQRILPGEVLTLSFMALQTGGLSNPTITVGMRDTTSTNVTATQVPIELTGLTTSYMVYTCTFQRASFSVIANEFLEIFTSASLSGTDFIQLDKFMLVRGKQPAAFSPNPIDTNNAGATNANPDISASASSIVPPDLGYASGIQGGGFVKDTGGRLDLFTLLQ